MIKKQVTYSFVTEADTANLSTVRKFVTDNLLTAGLDHTLISEIVLAVDEACTNIIKHAYKKGAPKPVRIEIGLYENLIRVVIADEGTGFIPENFSKPDLLQRIKSRQPGGMGVYLMQQLMDTVEYSRVGATNEVKLIKFL